MFFLGKTVVRAVVVVAPVLLAQAASAGSLTRLDADNVAVRATGVPIGQVLSELNGMKRLNNLFIEPAVESRTISVAIDKVGLADAAVQILTQSGLDFIVWGDRIFVGDPKTAVQLNQGPVSVAEVVEAAPVEESPASAKFATDEYSMDGENVKFADPTFVTYKNRPEVRERRMKMDVATIP